MRKCCFISLAILFLGWLAGVARAETLELTDGSSVTGEMILPANLDGLNFKLASGKYQRVPWANFTQASLLELAKNPKLVPFVESLIEPQEDERIKKTEIVVKPVDRLERPGKGSLFGALFHTGIGLLAVLLIYAGSIYAAYEISVVRAYPPLLVCGVSAIIPVIGQIVFLCMPTRIESSKDRDAAEAAVKVATRAEVRADIAAATHPGARLQLSPELQESSASAMPEAQVFQRGKFTFNRRFFETKFSAYFGVVRREAEKDMLLIVKTARDEFVVQRITRIATNEMHIEVHKGNASQEINMPFADVHEVVLKHRNDA